MYCVNPSSGLLESTYQVTSTREKPSPCSRIYDLLPHQNTSLTTNTQTTSRRPWLSSGNCYMVNLTHLNPHGIRLVEEGYALFEVHLSTLGNSPQTTTNVWVSLLHLDRRTSISRCCRDNKHALAQTMNIFAPASFNLLETLTTKNIFFHQAS